MAVSRSSTPICTCKPKIKLARATSCISSTIFLYRSPGVISCMRQSAKGCVAAERDHVATQLLDFFFGIFDVVANCGTDLDHGGVHLRFHFLLKDQLAFLDDL